MLYLLVGNKKLVTFAARCLKYFLKDNKEKNYFKNYFKYSCLRQKSYYICGPLFEDMFLESGVGSGSWIFSKFIFKKF